MAELGGGSSSPAPQAQPRPVDSGQASLVASWRKRAPWVSPLVVLAAVSAGLDPDSPGGQAIADAGARQSQKKNKGIFGRIGEVVHGGANLASDVADFVTPEAAEDVIGVGAHVAGAVASNTLNNGPRQIVRGGLTGLQSAYETGQGLVRNVASGVGEVAAGVLSGAAVGAGTGAGVGLLGGPFAPLTSTAGAIGGAVLGGVVGGVATAIADPDVEGEADWNVLHWSTGGLAVDRALRGEDVDLGSGWLPGANLVEEQAKRAREQASINGHALTPGRLLAADIVEPGTTQYNILSGLGDMAVAFAPFEPGALAAKGAGAGTRAAMRSWGAIDAARLTIDASRAQGFLASNVGRRVVQKIADTNGPEAFNEIWHLTNQRLPAHLVLDLADESDPARVADLLHDALGTTVRDAPQFPRLPTINRNMRRVRILQEMPGAHLDTNDIDAALKTFDAAQRNARLSESVIARNNRALAEAKTPGEMYRVVVDGFLNEDLANQIARHTPDTRRGRELARRLTTAWRDHHDELTKYAVDDFGDNMHVPGAVIDGTGKATAAPHLSVEYLNGSIPLPDARGVRQATSFLGRVARSPGVDVPVSALDHFQQDMWKPMALLRAAWTIRVVGEEQVRMAAAGMSSVFHHPISHLAMVIGKHGDVGIEGDELLRSAEGIAALGQGSAGWRNRARVAGKTLFDRERDVEYPRAWADELAQLFTDPASKRLAGGVEWVPGQIIAAADDGTSILATGNHLEDVKAWFSNGKGRRLRDQLESMGAPVRTKAEADALVQSWFDRLQIKTGGDPELLDLVATGEFGGHALIKKPGQVNSRVIDALDEKRLLGQGPQKVKGDLVLQAPTDAASRFGQRLDRAVESMFNTLMTRPSNYLSRSPAFRQFYWKRVEELLPSMTAGSQEKALTNALRSELPKNVMQSLEAAAKKGSGELLSEDADILAKAFGLDETRALLYDLSKKSQFFDVHRLLFPFGEAWKEIAVTWAKIGLQHPEAIRRGQQVITSARSTNPDDLGVGGIFGHGHAFFYRDANGEEVLAYPGSEFLTESLIGVPVPLTGRVEGLSIGTSVIPAVGLVVQIPAGSLLPETPDWDWVRRTILPFGDPTTDEGFVESTLPAWLQKLRTSGLLKGIPVVGAEPSAQQERALAGAAFDLLAYQISAGTRQRPKTMEEIQAGVDENMDAARLLYTISGAAQFAAPTAPTPEMRVLDKSGNLIVLNELRNRYRELGDDEGAGGWATATDRFLDKYGESALFAIQPRSTATSYALPVTTEGDEWVRAHPDIKKRFRNTYGLWAPTGGDFDVTAYSRQFDSDERQGLTVEQMVQQANSRIGNAIYSNVVRAAGEKPNAQQRLLLRQMRDRLRDEFPGFGSDIAGVGKKTDLDTAIKELRRGLTVPELAQSEAGEGLSQYLTVRDAAQARAVQIGLTTFRGASAAEPLRLLLRKAADAILAEHPAFGQMWENVFSREMDDDDQEEKAAA